MFCLLDLIDFFCLCFGVIAGLLWFDCFVLACLMLFLSCCWFNLYLCVFVFFAGCLFVCFACVMLFVIMVVCLVGWFAVLIVAFGGLFGCVLLFWCFG